MFTQKEDDMGNNNQFEEDEDLFVTLTLDDDTEVDCLVVSIFEAERTGLHRIASYRRT